MSKMSNTMREVLLRCRQFSIRQAGSLRQMDPASIAHQAIGHKVGWTKPMPQQHLEQLAPPRIEQLKAEIAPARTTKAAKGHTDSVERVVATAETIERLKAEIAQQNQNTKAAEAHAEAAEAALAQALQRADAAEAHADAAEAHADAAEAHADAAEAHAEAEKTTLARALQRAEAAEAHAKAVEVRIEAQEATLAQERQRLEAVQAVLAQARQCAAQRGLRLSVDSVNVLQSFNRTTAVDSENLLDRIRGKQQEEFDVIK